MNKGRLLLFRSLSLAIILPFTCHTADQLQLIPGAPMSHFPATSDENYNIVYDLAAMVCHEELIGKNLEKLKEKKEEESFFKMVNETNIPLYDFPSQRYTLSQFTLNHYAILKNELGRYPSKKDIPEDLCYHIQNNLIPMCTGVASIGLMIYYEKSVGRLNSIARLGVVSTFFLGTLKPFIDVMHARRQKGKIENLKSKVSCAHANLDLFFNKQLFPGNHISFMVGSHLENKDRNNIANILKDVGYKENQYAKYLEPPAN